ncbi:DUF3581 family protein [Aliikangiella marina]|uniref:DUF3581 family protein n=1 Tax=Aliikangiella marina TaxID=1712262 RepID=A0A545TDF9_9GAMM|nr:DUF3581 family protein [Aliikangiella marina]TQV75206.1 DUF3581 family protein [Aliikangiella marina]
MRNLAELFEMVTLATIGVGMFLENFFTQSGDKYSFSKQQGSDFAKEIAGDFNPLHDPDNNRFCIPGDLLFSLTSCKYGISQNMTFDFQGMVSGDSQVHFVENEDQIRVENDNQKSFLAMTREGDNTQDTAFVEALVRSYVAFSGKTFPHIIVELMKEEGVMVNPVKPMVIYDMMKLGFEKFSEHTPEVVLKQSRFDVNGKRGMVIMDFDICANDEVIGHGEKQIIMSGLRPYDQEGIDVLVNNYDQSRERFFANA